MPIRSPSSATAHKQGVALTPPAKSFERQRELDQTTIGCFVSPSAPGSFGKHRSGTHFGKMAPSLPSSAPCCRQTASSTFPTGTASTDQTKSFGKQHPNGGFSRKRSVADLRPSDRRCLLTAVRRKLHRPDTGCSGTPFGSTIFPSLRGNFGKELSGTDSGKSAASKPGEDRYARPVPPAVPIRDGRCRPVRAIPR